MKARLGAGVLATLVALVVAAGPVAGPAAAKIPVEPPYGALYTPCESWSGYYGYWAHLEVVNTPCHQAAKVANVVYHWVGKSIADKDGKSHRVGGFTCKLTELQGEYNPYAIVLCHASHKRRIGFMGAP